MPSTDEIRRLARERLEIERLRADQREAGP
jgi:hypothetical protein